MIQDNTTCWLLVEEAASGKNDARNQFAQCYEPIVRAYLSHRWRKSTYIQHVDDAVQELFVECFKGGGVLERADSSRSSGFRAYLYGVARNIALRFESGQARLRKGRAPSYIDASYVADDEASLSRVFDRSWLESLLKQAAKRQADLAQLSGESAIKRVELLELRFRDNLSFGQIAKLWGVESSWLYKEGARAREEFKQALHEVVSFHNPQSPAEIEKECAELLALLS